MQDQVLALPVTEQFAAHIKFTVNIIDESKFVQQLCVFDFEVKS